MENNKYEEIFAHVLPAIESKRNEFFVYQYETVSEKDIWKYCVTKKWRKKDISLLPLYQIINDILTISPAEFMTFEQIDNQRTSNWFAEINQDELRMLLNSDFEEK
ncbi:post-transcriptional regulator [Psychrobacillus sp. FSL K6-4615]|uniref:post-transcriptional regulator n=1 Tax=Psychrobacillus sp. FSL K6-4615 TaxID=2921551 RepID=UPI0030FB4716